MLPQFVTGSTPRNLMPICTSSDEWIIYFNRPYLPETQPVPLPCLIRIHPV